MLVGRMLSRSTKIIELQLLPHFYRKHCGFIYFINTTMMQKLCLNQLYCKSDNDCVTGSYCLINVDFLVPSVCTFNESFGLSYTGSNKCSIRNANCTAEIPCCNPSLSCSTQTSTCVPASAPFCVISPNFLATTSG